MTSAAVLPDTLRAILPLCQVLLNLSLEEGVLPTELLELLSLLLGQHHIVLIFHNIFVGLHLFLGPGVATPV